MKDQEEGFACIAATITLIVSLLNSQIISHSQSIQYNIKTHSFKTSMEMAKSSGNVTGNGPRCDLMGSILQ